jgi:hypothetical protein
MVRGVARTTPLGQSVDRDLERLVPADTRTLARAGMSLHRDVRGATHIVRHTSPRCDAGDETMDKHYGWQKARNRRTPADGAERTALERAIPETTNRDMRSGTQRRVRRRLGSERRPLGLGGDLDREDYTSNEEEYAAGSRAGGYGSRGQAAGRRADRTADSPVRFGGGQWGSATGLLGRALRRISPTRGIPAGQLRRQPRLLEPGLLRQRLQPGLERPGPRLSRQGSLRNQDPADQSPRTGQEPDARPDASGRAHAADTKGAGFAGAVRQGYQPLGRSREGAAVGSPDGRRRRRPSESRSR